MKKTIGCLPLIIMADFVLAQNLSDLNLIAHYPLSVSAEDVTGLQEPMHLDNTPFEDGGIYCNGIYADSPGACDAFTPELKQFTFKKFAISTEFKVSDPTVMAAKPLFVFGRSWRWMYVLFSSDSLLGFEGNRTYHFTRNTWNTVIVTFDSVTAEAECYLNGHEVDSEIINLNYPPQKNISITHSGFGTTFMGHFKNLKIYSKHQTFDAMLLDSLALVTIYNNFDGPNWTHRDNWLSGPVASWYGVTIEERRVTALNLADNNLTGSLPPEIGNLTAIGLINLWNNQLSGSIPREIGQLTSLFFINLNDNQFSGSIPPEIGNLVRLQRIEFSDNQLSGTIPSEIGNLIELVTLYLERNQIEGTIPHSISGCTHLRNFSASSNQIYGTIPEEIGKCIEMRNFSVGSNQMTGQIPEQLTLLTHLETLGLERNQFYGAVPPGMTFLTQLKYLYLHENDFIDLPNLSSLTQLTKLTIQGNRFTFEDIETNIGITEFVYSPQDSFGIEQDIEITPGESFSLFAPDGGVYNLYQWMQDGAAIDGANSASYEVVSATEADEGEYICQITNSIAPKLTIYTTLRRVHITDGTRIAGPNLNISKTCALFQNMPNPFNPITVISFDVMKPCHVLLQVFNVRGEETRRLVDHEYASGRFHVNFEADELQSGIYFYRIQMGDFEAIQKMMVID